MLKVVFALFALLISVLSVKANDPVASVFPVRAELITEKAAFILGEPIYLKFQVWNPTGAKWQLGFDGDAYNSAGRPENFSVSVNDEQGQPILLAEEGWNLPRTFRSQIIRAYGHYDFSLFLSDWVKLSKPGKIIITVKRPLALAVGDDLQFFSQKDLKIPAEASASVEILPADSAKLGELIDQLGKTMVLGDRLSLYRGTSYMRLRAIDDPRVIPYFVRALMQKRYIGIEVLGRYADDSAFRALKKAMQTTGADIMTATTPQQAEQDAARVRYSAAVALSRSPHPEALDFLIAQRHDVSYSVRLTVVRRLVTLDENRSVPLLQEMALDSNLTVSREAKRALKEIETKHHTP